jgi:hypothetical protein
MTDLGPQVAGMLPWDVDFDQFWKFNFGGTDFHDFYLA